MTSVHALLTLAATLFRENQYSKAIVISTQLLERDPGVPSAWAIRGISRYHKGEIPSALNDLQRALALDPTSHRARHVLAQCWAHQGQPEKALSTLPPENLAKDTLEFKAKLQRSMHCLAGAIASETKMASLQPEKLEITLRVAQNILKEGDPEMAKAVLDQMNNLESDTTRLHRAVVLALDYQPQKPHNPPATSN